MPRFSEELGGRGSLLEYFRRSSASSCTRTHLHRSYRVQRDRCASVLDLMMDKVGRMPAGYHACQVEPVGSLHVIWYLQNATILHSEVAKVVCQERTRKIELLAQWEDIAHIYTSNASTERKQANNRIPQTLTTTVECTGRSIERVKKCSYWESEMS